MAASRKLIVKTAQVWFDGAREAQRHGRWSEALLCMENALNHTENALVASRGALKPFAAMRDKFEHDGLPPRIAMIDCDSARKVIDACG